MIERKMICALQSEWNRIKETNKDDDDDVDTKSGASVAVSVRHIPTKLLLLRTSLQLSDIIM